MTEIADNASPMPEATSTGRPPGTWPEVLAVFLRLGLTSFVPARPP
jgi:hypothetical protein